MFSTLPFILIMIELLFIDSSLLNLSASTAIDRIDSPETALLLRTAVLIKRPKELWAQLDQTFFAVTSQQILLKTILMKLRCLNWYQFRFVQNSFNYFLLHQFIFWNVHLNLLKYVLTPSILLKSLLSSKGQKRNTGAWKMNLFTPMAELWNMISCNPCSKKVHFSSTSIVYCPL